MKRIAIIMTLLTVSLTFTFGQTVTDSISMKKVFGGYVFYQGEKILYMNELVNLIKPNEQAYKQIKTAQWYNTLASITEFAGGVMIGLPIGTAIRGGEPIWALAGIGVVFIVATIPLSQKIIKHAKRAVDIYNGGLQTSSFWDKNELRFSMAGNGIGITFRF